MHSKHAPAPLVLETVYWKHSCFLKVRVRDNRGLRSCLSSATQLTWQSEREGSKQVGTEANALFLASMQRVPLLHSHGLNRISHLRFQTSGGDDDVPSFTGGKTEAGEELLWLETTDLEQGRAKPDARPHPNLWQTYSSL